MDDHTKRLYELLWRKRNELADELNGLDKPKIATNMQLMMLAAYRCVNESDNDRSNPLLQLGTVL